MNNQEENHVFIQDSEPFSGGEIIYMDSEMNDKYRKRKNSEATRTKVSRILKTKCDCSGSRVKDFFTSVFPILYWLPHYEFRKSIIGDVAAGVTVGIVQIPQGMAYALLATLPPINGLYVSFFPVVLYPFFGTSRQLSIGTFAVISILISSILDQRVPASYCGDLTTGVPEIVATTTQHYVNITTSTMFENFTSSPSADSYCEQLYNMRKVEVSIAISIAVGLLQILMYLFQLGIITVFLSESLVSGFVSGASIHVITSQIPKLFGITVSRHTGPLELVYKYIELFTNFASINWGTFVVSLCCTVLLIAGKELNVRFRRKMPVPIPWELFLVIFSTIASYYGHFEDNHDVVIVGDIPTGIVTSLPKASDISLVFVDAIPVTIVAFAVEISLCQIFATKHAYEIDSNQELLALGACNIFGAFFSCFPSASSLSRSVISDEVGAKTQLSGLFSSIVVLCILLWVGPVFESLPQATLAVIIIVNIKSLLLLWKERLKARNVHGIPSLPVVKPLWKVSRLDAMTWMVTWFSVVLLGVTMGLFVGVAFSILTVLLRTRGAKIERLGKIPGSDDYRSTLDYRTVSNNEAIFVFHFSGPVYFANKDRFSQQFAARLGFDPIKELSKSITAQSAQGNVTLKLNDVNSSDHGKENGKDSCNNHDVTMAHGDEIAWKPILKKVPLTSTAEEMAQSRDDVKRFSFSHVVFDMSQCSFVDSDGAKLISGINASLGGLEIRLLLASCNDDVKSCLERFLQDSNSMFFVSLSKAVQFAEKSKASTEAHPTVSGVNGAQDSVV